LGNLISHQPKPTYFRAELVLNGQFERSAMHRPQVFCSGVIKVDCAIAQREAKEFNLTLWRLSHLVVRYVPFGGC